MREGVGVLYGGEWSPVTGHTLNRQKDTMEKYYLPLIFLAFGYKGRVLHRDPLLYRQTDTTKNITFRHFFSVCTTLVT